MSSIKDFKECPHCGSDFGYYSVFRVYGTSEDTRDFDGEPMNWEMWAPIRTRTISKWYRCKECRKKICKITE